MGDILTGGGHAYGAVAGRDAVHVAVRPDAHGGSDRQTGVRHGHFDRPLHLLHVLEVLTTRTRTHTQQTPTDMYTSVTT